MKKIANEHKIVHQEAKEAADIASNGYNPEKSEVLLEKFRQMEHSSMLLFELLDSIIKEHHDTYTSK